MRKQLAHNRLQHHLAAGDTTAATRHVAVITHNPALRGRRPMNYLRLPGALLTAHFSSGIKHGLSAVIPLALWLILLVPTAAATPPDVVQRWVRQYPDPSVPEPDYGSDAGRRVRVDGDGNVYVMGSSTGNGTKSDIATIKYDRNGNRLWVSRYNGPANTDDYPREFADPLQVAAGYVYVCGASNNAAGNADFITIKYKPGGDTAWTRRYEAFGGSVEAATGLKVDAVGNVIVAGFGEEWGEGMSLQTLKYGPSGNVLWHSHWAPGTYNPGRLLGLDAAGNVYISGSGRDWVYPGYNYATAKLDPNNGGALWTQLYNGPRDSEDVPMAMAVDGAGNVYVTGWRDGDDPYGVGADYATLKYNSSGVLQWAAPAVYAGTGGTNSPTAIQVRFDTVYVTGKSQGVGTGFDWATIKYAPNGAQLWVARYNGLANVDDIARDLRVDADGNVYVTGFTYNAVSGADWKTVKYNAANGDSVWSTVYTGSVPGGHAGGQAYALELDGSGNVYVTGVADGNMATIMYARDRDLDGVADLDDNCPFVANPLQIDADHDGFGAACDCEDTLANINPNTVWYRDLDGDGYGHPGSTLIQCSQPSGYVLDNTDCNDSDPLINPNTVWHRDGDGDGYGHPDSTLIQCTQPVGYVRDGSDCDDSDPLINPNTIWYRDLDGDGYGHPGSTLIQCSYPYGYVLDSSDCNDSNPSINPSTIWHRDWDGDGYGRPDSTVIQCLQPSGYIRDSTDCDDSDPSINPSTIWSRDRDGDGYGRPDSTLIQCTQPDGYVRDSTDCDDGDHWLNPNTVWHRDLDGDGYGRPDSTLIQCTQPDGYVRDSTDCNDADHWLNPNTVWHRDFDGDGYGRPDSTLIQCLQPVGYVRDSTDCNDGDPSRNPGAIEVCNGVDEDCDGIPDNGFADTDHNGVGDVCEPGYTPTGTQIRVNLYNGAEFAVTVQFDQVTAPGVTSVTTNPIGPLAPPGFTVVPGLPGLQPYYEIHTTATFSGRAWVCMYYHSQWLSRPKRNLRLNHFDGSHWEDVTASNDTVNNWICGRVTSFSPFLMAEPICDCACHGDPVCDTATDVLDVVTTINVAFRGTSATLDSDCPAERTDLDCSGATDVIDVVKVINVAFRGANAAVEFCAPCLAGVAATTVPEHTGASRGAMHTPSVTIATVATESGRLDALLTGKPVTIPAIGSSPRLISLPLSISTSRSLTAAVIPLRFAQPGDGITMREVRFDRRFNESDLKIANIDNDAKTVVIALIPMATDPAKPDLAPGSGVVAELEFAISDPLLTSFVIEAATAEQSRHRMMWVYNEDVGGHLEVRWTAPTFDPVTVSVMPAGQGSSLPDNYALGQNYPNPFNPSTAIRFAMPQGGRVHLAVYNVLGQKVRTLVDEDREAGVYNAIWDGTNENGSSVSSGIYLYRLITGDFVETKKMILLK